MYFEEKIMGDMLFYRNTPDGDWIPYSPEQLAANLSHSRGVVADLVSALKTLVEAHGDSSYLDDAEKEADPDVIAARAALAKAGAA